MTTAPTRETTRVVIHRAGSWDRLTLETVRTPEPGPREVRVEVRAAGVNYADVIVRMGLYSSARELVGWPITPGFEVAGVVSAVGRDVDDLEIGARVFAVSLFGGYASDLVVPRHQVFPVPDTMSFVEAASVPAVAMTAWFALFELAHPRPGAKVLVHSAAGGVGLSLVQMAKRAGCEVVGVVGGSHKVEAARAYGCDHVIDKSSRDLWTEAERLAPSGYDVIADANGVAKKKLSGAAKTKLQSYGWRGNIRELENTMHRAILISIEDEMEPDAIHIQDSAFSNATSASAGSANKAPDPTGVGSAGTKSAPTKPVQNPGGVETLVGKTIAEVERDMIVNTLEHCLGNRTHAANILGISIRTLRNKLNQYKEEGVNLPPIAAGGEG